MDIYKTRYVHTPEYGTAGSAGIDFFVPYDFAHVLVAPGVGINIPSGIHAKIPTGYALIAFNKSGIAVNTQFIVGACVVDSDYQGEIHLHMINASTEIQEIVPGMKLCQFILLPYNKETLNVVKEWPFTEKTARGSNGFGSTNKKEIV